MTSTLNFISQLYPPAPKEILVESKMRTGVSLLSRGMGASVTPERHIPRKKGILNHLQCLLQERIQFQIKILTY